VHILHTLMKGVDFMKDLCYISENLFNLRNSINLSQSYVSNVVHIDRTILSKYESGILVPSLPILFKLANFYNVDIDYLLSKNNIF